MYFKNINNTNIDEDFNDNNLFSKIKNICSKYKILVIIGIIFIFLIIMILLFYNKKIENYLFLLGEETITIYEESDYIEPGFDAYNSKNEELNNEVIINSNLNTRKKGNYEITYTLGEITKKRKVNVVEKTKSYTYIYLNAINNDINIYLPLGSDYIEPGYKVYSNSNIDLTDKVQVTGNVDVNKKGSYKLTYTVINDEGITISKSRLVTIIDTEVELSLSNTNWTNNSLTINIDVKDDYFDYIILPDNTKIKDRIYNYEVSENGEYKFKVYNQKGIEKNASITIKNIDKTSPTGSCTVDQNEKGSYITIKATDTSGINKYEYDGKYYASNIINLASYIDKASVIIYDKANNSKKITCSITPIAFIQNIEKDGIIIKIKAKKVNKEISGYYFSYTNKRPEKNKGGYIATSKESIDVVRLPGTTYVWVEDINGRISSPKTIKILNSDLLDTSSNSQYKILQGTSLKDYLSNQGWSIEELNKLIARSARAAGLYSKEAAATSAISLQTVLAQKYKIKLPYESAGLYRKPGAKETWGKQGYNYITDKSGYYGMDCSAFVTWTYVNAGYDIGSSNLHPAYWSGWKRLDFKPENADIGDFLVVGKVQGNRHVKLIIGKTDSEFITAEAKGGTNGMIITTHSYSKANGYKVQKAENITNLYDKYSNSNYPTGF